MLEIINLPQVGESIVEGTIAKWLKQPGDAVKKYEPLVEVVTDKVTMEVPSPIEGTVTKLLAAEGETITVGSPILEIDIPSDDASPVTDHNSKDSRTGFLVENITQVGPTGGTPLENLSESQTTQPELQSRKVSPAVRRLAQELSVNLDSIAGTGINGRVTKNDILSFKSSQNETFNESFMAANIEASPIRKIIAENMLKSYSQIPHAWTMIEVDVSDLVSIRERVKTNFLDETGFNLTYMPFFIASVISAIKENMNFNAEWHDNNIKHHENINLGIAVASTSGLIVPVIHNADKLTFKELAAQTNSLINKANTNRLTLNEVQHGTFTINNTGALGSILSKPIINGNQSGIITMESVQRRPVVIGEGISIRSVMNVCLSFDHRLNDGHEASKLLSTVKNYLETLPADFAI